VTPAFWRGRRVFLTGHTGFKGGWLSLWLRHLGAEVTGYALTPPTTPSLFELAGIGRDLRSIIADVDDLPRLKQELRDARPEVVFHLAAQPLVHAGYDNPVETYRTNVMGSVHLLEAARGVAGLRAVINVTTDKCYENPELDEPFRETDRLGGFDPYSNSKGCSELVTQAYRNAFFPPDRHAAHGVAVASARAGNVIGGGDWGKDRLVPDILRSIAAGQPVRIRRPDAIRPWQHVLEPLSGYLQLAEKLVTDGPRYGSGWNFGPRDEDARPVRWIAEQLTRLWGPPARWETEDRQYPHEAHFLRLDCRKAHETLGWRPRMALSQALEWIVEWHRAVGGGADAREQSLAQIRRYEQLSPT
jgi:CDP-glucose 4,6-dehydratase